MKRWHFIVLGVIVLGVVLALSIAGTEDSGETVYAEPAKVQTVQSVVSAPGEVDPKLKVNISAHVIGKIEKLYFKEGDVVRRGDKLVDLEKPNYVAQRDRMRSELASRRIEVDRARVAMHNAELNFNRASKLREQGIQAQELYDRSQVELENARAAYASAQENVREVQAGLTQAEVDLDRTTIVAPMDGKIVQLNAHEGEVVITGTMNNPGSVIAVLADLSEILVETEVVETEVVQVKIGQTGRIFVDAIPDKQYQGRVVEVGSSATVRQTGGGGGVRVFIVKVAITDPDDRLRPGMTSRVEIVTNETKSATVVPIQSVVERTAEGIKKGGHESDDESVPKKKYVFVVKDKAVKAVEVTTGISDTMHVAIGAGVKPGDQIVTGPVKALRKLRDGDSVEVKKEQPAGSSDDGNDDKK